MANRHDHRHYYFLIDSIPFQHLSVRLIVSLMTKPIVDMLTPANVDFGFMELYVSCFFYCYGENINRYLFVLFYNLPLQTTHTHTHSRTHARTHTHTHTQTHTHLHFIPLLIQIVKEFQVTFWHCITKIFRQYSKNNRLFGEHRPKVSKQQDEVYSTPIRPMPHIPRLSLRILQHDTWKYT